MRINRAIPAALALLVVATGCSSDPSSGDDAANVSSSGGELAAVTSEAGSGTSAPSGGDPATALSPATTSQAPPTAPSASPSAGSSAPTASPTSGTVPAALRSDGAALVAAVDRGRLMSDIETVAAGPRDNVQNHAAALAAAEHVAGEFSAAGLQPRRIDVEAVGVSLPVIWTEITGSGCAAGEAVPTYVLTAHYDTVPGSPGADDDASGVAAVVEIGRILADQPLRASVVLAVVPFEELGEEYPGAAALADLLLQDPRRSLRGMISAEMLGYSTQQPDSEGKPGDYLNLLAHEGSDALAADFRAAAAQWVPDFEVQAATFPPDTGFINRSDNAAFQERGVPTGFASDGADFRTPYYHSPQDVPANISQQFLVDSTRVLLAWLVLSSGREQDC